VVGIFMKNWEDDDDSDYCSSNVDFVDAAAVADVIGIEIEHVNFAAEYKDRVFAEFLREYQAGRTPNPDVLCNAEIKFKAFLDHAMRLGAEKIATGHYARVREIRHGRLPAAQGPGPAAKDQSYFLHRLNQAQLAKHAVPGGRAAQDRGARASPARSACPTRRRRTRPASASSASGLSASSSTATSASSPGRSDDRGRRIGRTWA
jgi:tRNA-specific 2-thiouridylase